MKIPDKLKVAIAAETEKYAHKQLVEARVSLSEKYKERQDKQFITSAIQRAAYAAARMPATFAAVKRVLEEIQARLPDIEISSLLDLGAGPGTATWAAAEAFPSLQRATLVEKDRELGALGQRLAQGALHQKLAWQWGDLESIGELPENDLVILSYSIGELSQSAMVPLIEKCWKAARRLLVIVEPGTPVGFERIRLLRSHLIGLGAHMVAPCPHELACPMSGGDWCHFSARVERTSLHRQMKAGTLGYEDEKFSYIAFAKEGCDLPESRILRHPQKRSGHILLQLCMPDGLKAETISKSDGELYKIAKKCEWGDALALRKA